MRFNFRYAIITVTIFILEIFVATVFAPISEIRGSVSDILVVILIYYLILTFRFVPPIPLTLGIFAFACAVEIAQYFHIADVLGFKRGSLPSILIGTTFTFEDIFMYGLGCLIAWATNLYLWKEKPTRKA